MENPKTHLKPSLVANQAAGTFIKLFLLFLSIVDDKLAPGRLHIPNSRRQWPSPAHAHE